MAKEKLKLSTILDSPLLDSIVAGIGEVASITGVSQRQIRYWETKGIINSCVDDISGSNKKYDYPNIEKIVLIKDFLDQGFTLEAAAKRLEDRITRLNSAIEKLTTLYHEKISRGKPVIGLKIELYDSPYIITGVAEYKKGGVKLLICQPQDGDKTELLAEPIIIDKRKKNN